MQFTYLCQVTGCPVKVFLFNFRAEQLHVTVYHLFHTRHGLRVRRR